VAHLSLKPNSASSVGFAQGDIDIRKVSGDAAEPALPRQCTSSHQLKHVTLFCSPSGVFEAEIEKTVLCHDSTRFRKGLKETQYPSF
jgi:hypothetical protein